MGKRSGTPDTEDDVAKLGLADLNRWIGRAETRIKALKLNVALRKSTMKRLVWLEAQRQRLYGVSAPKRERF